MSAGEVPALVLDNLHDGDRASIDDAGELVTVHCGICDQAITGKVSGMGSAVWKLGTHRYTKHKIRAGSPRRSPNAPTSDELAGDGASPVLAVVREIAEGMGGARKSSAPSAAELSAGLGRGLGLTTVAVASFMAETDPGIPEGPAGDAERERLIDYLALTDKAARDIMAPIGRAFAPTRLNAKYGRGAVQNVDVIASFAELATIGMHWRTYLRARGSGFARPPELAGPGAQVYGGDPEAAARNGGQAPPMFAPGLITPAPQSGYVVGPEDVARIQREAAGR